MLRFLPIFILTGFFLELAVMIAVGREIGILATLLLIIAAGMLGGAVIRAAGFNLIGALHRPDMNRSFATRDAGAQFLLLLAGFLLIVPGFLTDVLGLLLLPGVVRRWLAGKFVGKATWQSEVHATQWRGQSRPAGPVIEGEAVEIEGEIARRPELERDP